MRPSSISTTLLLSSFSLLFPQATSSPLDANTMLPFNFTYLFTATLNLGPANKPISINSNTGVIVPEQILNGTVTGPAINGTITAGLAFPSVYKNGTIQAPLIEVYGVTDDGVALYIKETGVGSPTGQMTRIEMSIGGGNKYETLRDGFILTAVTPSADRTKVTAQGYLIQHTAGG